jgi:hypothetical protein
MCDRSKDSKDSDTLGCVIRYVHVVDYIVYVCSNVVKVCIHESSRMLR